MMRRSRRRSAFRGLAAAVDTAASRAGEGLYAAGRGVADHGLQIGWRAWEGAIDSGRRAYVAARVYRGDRYGCARPPVAYVTAGVIVGLSAAAAAGTVVRAVRRGPEGGPGGGRRLADAVLAVSAAVTRHGRGGEPATVPPTNRTARTDHTKADTGGVRPLPPTARHAAGEPPARAGARLTGFGRRAAA